MTRSEAPAPSLERVLRSRLEDVDSICLQMRNFLRDQHLAPRAFAVELVARECLNNAVIHGNQGNKEKRVRIKLTVGRRWIRVTVSDEGQGFRPPRTRRCECDTASHGRGLSICALYAAKVTFNRLGNQVNLWLEKTRSQRSSDGKLHGRTR